MKPCGHQHCGKARLHSVTSPPWCSRYWRGPADWSSPGPRAPPSGSASRTLCLIIPKLWPMWLSLSLTWHFCSSLLPTKTYSQVMKIRLTTIVQWLGGTINNYSHYDYSVWPFHITQCPGVPAPRSRCYLLWSICQLAIDLGEGSLTMIVCNDFYNHRN